MLADGGSLSKRLLEKGIFLNTIKPVLNRVITTFGFPVIVSAPLSMEVASSHHFPSGKVSALFYSLKGNIASSHFGILKDIPGQ